MSIFEQIQQDTTDAMKARRDAELSTLRLLRAALKNRQIDLMRELTDDDVFSVIRSQIKQTKDAILSFETGGRRDLVEKAQVEIQILQRYLPASLSDEALADAVRSALQEAGISRKADMGRAMGVAMKAVAGQAEGERVKQVVESCLE